MWQAQIHALICERANVHFYSHNLTNRQISAAFMRPCRDIADRVGELANANVRRSNSQFGVCVLPEGPQTIPFLK